MPHMLISKSHSDGPSAGPPEASGLAEAHGLPKVHRPRGHCTPLLGGFETRVRFLVESNQKL